ncbi:DUF3515 domain-containing protein [Streptomyces sp. NRRL B-24484]|uniref:DUF3515 domain-containing protein n=1 Tax=Streptomyces sp. NRRL B-24484 TaxID=1463833 RepID=UPI0004C11C93|nr:DUF3515 domain-containing protein [Streptomyces sp. NRRL B-24484]
MASSRPLASLPAPVRWLAPPAALLGCTLLLVGNGGGDEVAPPAPSAAVARYCEALDRALPQSVQGHARRDPTPASPYTAAWASSPRTVLRCGIERPGYLDDDPLKNSPEINGVQWGFSRDGDGGYRFVTTLRKAYVEVLVPKGAYPNYADPIPAISDAVRTAIPEGL